MNRRVDPGRFGCLGQPAGLVRLAPALAIGARKHRRLRRPAHGDRLEELHRFIVDESTVACRSWTAEPEACAPRSYNPPTSARHNSP